MQNIIPILKKTISMNREIYQFEKSYEEEQRKAKERVRESVEAMQKALNAYTGNVIEPMLYAAIPRQSGRGYRGLEGLELYEELRKEALRKKAIFSIKAKYQGNRSERRSKNKKNNNTSNERTTTLQDIIKQKQNRVRYSFNSTNISDKFSNNKYDKGINNRW